MKVDCNWRAFPVFRSNLSFFFPASLWPPEAFDMAPRVFWSSPSFFLASSTADGSALFRRRSLNSVFCFAISSVTDSIVDMERNLAVVCKRRKAGNRWTLEEKPDKKSIRQNCSNFGHDLWLVPYRILQSCKSFLLLPSSTVSSSYLWTASYAHSIVHRSELQLLPGFDRTTLVEALSILLQDWGDHFQLRCAYVKIHGILMGLIHILSSYLCGWKAMHI